MRSRRPTSDQVAEVARRRLELLSAELAEIRPDPVDPPVPGSRDGSGEPSKRPALPTVPPTAPLSALPTAPPTGLPTRASLPGPGRHAHRPVGLGAAISGWTQDRLPPALQGRVWLSGTHLAVVGLLLLGGLALTAWWVSRADRGSTALPPVSSSTAPLVTPSVAASPSPSPTLAAPGVAGSPGVASAGTSPGGRIVVDVAGKVRQPGIATLPSGSRVVDALKAAGGPRRGAPLGSLNLARVLTDGEQILVGVRSPPGVAASAASGGGGAPGSGGSAVPMVNINTADQAQLEELPGVGPVTARSILDYRAERGTFTAVDELLEVSGIGDATLAKIAPYCTL